MDSNQIIVMGLCFSAMLGFGGLTAWMWARHGPKRRAEQGRNGAAVASSVASSASTNSQPATPEFEPTALVTPPAPDGAMEVDASATVLLPAAEVQALHDAPTPPSEGATEHLPPPPGLGALTDTPAPAPSAEDPADKTAFFPPPPAAEPELHSPEPEPQAPESELHAPEPELHAPEPEPQVDKTALVAPFLSPTPTGDLSSTPAVAQLPAPRPSSEDVSVPHHFELAVAALAQFSADPSVVSALRRWQGHATVLASVPADGLFSTLRPHLESSDSNHRVAASLLLLGSETWRAREHFVALVNALESGSQATALRVLASWEDPRANTIALAGLTHAETGPARCAWLQVFEDRGRDPGPEAIDDALAATDDITRQGLGLRLSLRHRPDAPETKAAIDALLFNAEPGLRMQAVEASLALGGRTAWILCEQLAKNPKFGHANILRGQLGTRSEAEMLAAALPHNPSPDALRGLGYAGRVACLDQLATQLEATDPSCASAALEGFCYATGYQPAPLTDPDPSHEFKPSSPGAAASAWWTVERASFSPDRRCLGGRVITAAVVLDQLRTAPLSTRRALARELRLRSGGDVHLYCGALPQAWHRQVEDLAARAELLDAIDFEAGFPWAGVLAQPAPGS